MKKHQLIAAAQKAGAAIGASLAIAQSAHANLVDNGAGSAQPSGTPSTLFDSSPGHPSVFQQVADTLIFVIGAVAVIMLIIGGARYVISQGNDADVKAAKDTILYAVVGIVVAILAFAIVHFVSGAISG